MVYLKEMFKRSKKFLRKCLDSGSDIFNTSMEFRATPISGMKYSPSQLLMLRCLRTRLPCLDSQLVPNVVMDAQNLLIQKQQLQKNMYDKNAKDMEPLEKGEIVQIRSNKWNPAIVKNVHMNPRSYIVESEDGGVYRRNRRHLLKTGESSFSSYTPTIDEHAYGNLPVTKDNVIDISSSNAQDDVVINDLSIFKSHQDGNNSSQVLEEPRQLRRSKRTPHLREYVLK